MFRVEIGGVEREIPDLPALQEFANNRLITPRTPVRIDSEGKVLAAGEIPGLIFLSGNQVRKTERDYVLPSSYPSYLPFAILSMIFCCMPFGVVATVDAVQADILLRQGKTGDAADAADKAKQWALWAAASGIALFILVFLYYANGGRRYSRYQGVPALHVVLIN
jgi:hypothetical protein